MGHIFADDRWGLVRSSAPRRSWLAVLSRKGFPCTMENESTGRIDPVTDLVEICQYADADRDTLLELTI